MTKVLRDAFGDLVGDEPPMRLDVAHIVVAGRRRRTRRRWTVSAAVAAVLVPVLGVGVAAAVRQPVQRGVGVVAERPVTTASSVGAPEASAGTGRPPSTEGTPGSSPPSAPSTPGTSGSAPGSGSEGLVDPGFEADPVSWDVFGPATTLASVRTVHGGQRAVRIATTGSQRSVAGATSRPVRVSTEAGARYTASCWVRATGPLDAYVQVQEYTTAWVRDAEPVKSTRFTLTDPAVWYRISVTYTAVRTGNLLPLTVFGSDMTAAGAVLLADDCSLRRS